MRRSLTWILAAAGTVAALAAAPAAVADASEPVPSLTPERTERLWAELVERPRASDAGADCFERRAVFYAANDWRRLTTKLAATPAACADYYVSVPPLSADKTQFRADEAWRIRALGPRFHALAEVNVTGWTKWVADNGSTWYEAGREARRRMAAAGYDVAAGDAWALNELSSAVRQGTGNARPNMRALLRGLYEGADDLPPAKGAVFIAGIGQGTTELSVYQARLQDWYEDAAFWTDLSAYASDWSQELYGDVRTWAVPGADGLERAAALDEYLLHQVALAAAAPPAAATAAEFLRQAHNPLANAAWAYDAAFGWTDVSYDLMRRYVSAQVGALQARSPARSGFAWAPKNLHALPTTEYVAQTDAVLDRLAAAIAAADPCAPDWCGGDLEGASFNHGWRTFASWKPSALAFASEPQTLGPGVPSAPLVVEQRTGTGVAFAAGLPLSVTFASSSSGGSFAPSADGPWSATLTIAMPSGATAVAVHYRDSRAGAATLTASAASRVAAAQVATVSSAPRAFPDFDGDGRAELALYRASSGGWYVSGAAVFGFGAAGDVAVPGDYDGDGDTDAAVYRPSTGGWHVRGLGVFGFGLSSDVPVPADYDGDGDTDIAVYRPSSGGWHVRGLGVFGWGTSSDVPVPGDYDGDGVAELAVFRPANGGWYVRGLGVFGFGVSTDVPVPADYDGDGTTDVAVFRPANGGWYVRGQGVWGFGRSGDVPVPADYDGDGPVELAVFRPASGSWHVQGQGVTAFGLGTDTVLALPYAARRALASNR